MGRNKNNYWWTWICNLRNEEKLPNKYRGIQFVTTGTLLGQQINLQKKTNVAVQARLNKEKGAWGIIKHRVFTDKQIKEENKFDLWAAAIGAIMKYGLTTLRINENMDRKYNNLHQDVWEKLYIQGQLIRSKITRNVQIMNTTGRNTACQL